MDERTFKQAADRFLEEYEVITEGTRSPKWVRGHRDRLRLHLLPFFGDLGFSQVTAGMAMEYRVHRRQTASTGKPPSPSCASLFGDIRGLKFTPDFVSSTNERLTAYRDAGFD